MKRLLLLLLLCGALSGLQANTPKKAYNGLGYKIILTIEGGSDSVMYLGNYYVGGTYASDTARRDSKGRFVFDRKDRRVLPGLWFFASPSGRHVDFVMYHETPDFTFTTREGDWTGNMQVKGSPENEIFFAYHRANNRLMARMDSAALIQDEAEKKAFRREVHRQLDQVKMDIIEQHPDCFVTLMMNATREPDVPRVSPEGDTLTPRQGWEYYMEHYFDYMRLDDDAIVRTPAAIFKDRVMNYLDRYLKGADAETLCLYIDKMIERARPSRETFKWLVHTVTEKYLQSNVMSYDAVYVHLVQRYYATGDAFWSSPSTIDMNVTRAAKWERLLIGKPAIDLFMKDDQGEIHQLYGQRHKYELLIFWSPTCGHCKTVIPALYQKYAELSTRIDIGAYAILSEPDDQTIPKWRTFIQEHHMDDPRWLNINGNEANLDWHEAYDIESTPQIYLLDRDKKILAKKLTAETFEMVIKQLENIE